MYLPGEFEHTTAILIEIQSERISPILETCYATQLTI